MKLKYLAVSILSLINCNLLHAQTVSGFNATGWSANVGSGSFTPGITNGTLYLTRDGILNIADSVFYKTQLSVNHDFNVSFNWAWATTNGVGGPADGFTFVIQNAANGNHTVGGANSAGSNLGYFGSAGIKNSVAVSILNFGASSGLGINTNAVINNVAASFTTLLSHGLNIYNGAGSNIDFNISYSVGLSRLIVTLTSGNATYAVTNTINLANVIGNSSAYFGFTGGSGSLSENQTISNLGIGIAPTPGGFEVLTPFDNGASDPQGSLVVVGNVLYGTTGFGGDDNDGTVFRINTDGSDFTNLYSFTDGDNGSGDGREPQAGLVLSGNTLYGTTLIGGENNGGTIFAINTDGSNFTNLYSFTGGDDGSDLRDGLILSSNKLYGTATYGGTNGFGTVFAINTDGTGFTNLYSFTSDNDDGNNPFSSLVLSGGTLYGTTQSGGTNGNGTIFAVNTDGTGYTNLYSFSGGNDGAQPVASLILAGNTLYGTAEGGGTSGNGTVFAINTDGSGFTNLYSFTGNDDGGSPKNNLVLVGDTLYGIASDDGINGAGTIFAINTNGTGFVASHSFDGDNDGNGALGGLVIADNTFYGTMSYGGINNNGTVFGFTPPVSLPLTITPVANQVTLTWPSWAVSYNLQSTTNLASGDWMSVIHNPNTILANNVYSNNLNANAVFFRLQPAGQ